MTVRSLWAQTAGNLAFGVPHFNTTTGNFAATLRLEVFNSYGTLLQSTEQAMAAGHQLIHLPGGYSKPGLYYLAIQAGSYKKVLKFTIL